MSYILLVEDDQQLADMVRELLSAEGFAVRHALVASKGLAIARQESPGLILMDLDLPDLNGMTMARIIRQRLGNRTPPMVAITGHVDGAHRQSAKQAGCRTFLAKPFTPQELIHTVKYFMEQQADAEEQTFRE